MQFSFISVDKRQHGENRAGDVTDKEFGNIVREHELYAISWVGREIYEGRYETPSVAKISICLILVLT